MGHPSSPKDDGRIELVNSQLSVEGDELVKKDIHRTTVIARHALKDLRSVELRKRIDRAGLWFMAMLAGGSYACWNFIPGGWGKAFAAFLVVLAFLCLLGIHKRIIRVEGPDGHADYDLVEDDAACEGFALSLRSKVREARGE